MTPRTLHVAVTTVAGLLVAGFVALYVGLGTVDLNDLEYRASQPLPVADRFPEDLFTAAYVVGVVLALGLVVLVERRVPLLAPLAVAVVLAACLGGILILAAATDPYADADLYPSWWRTLTAVQGLLLLAQSAMAIAILAVPPPATGERRRPPGTGVARVGTVVLKVDDLDRAARFWTAALGYTRYGDTASSPFLLPPDGQGPPLTLDTDDRTHLDLVVPDEATRRAEVDRLLALGATPVDGWAEVPHTVLSDPEGNLFCVVVHPDA
ncbi:hypothetical protein GCM10009557_85840 [Virgisporangium ochraceum]|uniref:Glyoxalase-like domain-containing protein n=1 Tax=Virgisporangium ochraceum TaxID=65505 RepID=A0A8J4A1Y2_9ACTN|nr:VOC family protein [Virgisporangium ochraceum]GIJ72345.1 hypothetical protein Voc01_072620 [Virgisporangium ochraceum]